LELLRLTKGDAREWARRYLGRHPLLFYNYYRMRPGYRNLLVDRRTQIVIEGFPRSGNTFAVVAFQQAQRERLRVAHHLHMPAQVIRAAQWGIPTLLLARKPTDAALSWVIREPGLPIRQALKHYVSFYEKAAEYREALVVGFFEEVTRDYGRVLERVNAKFGTEFSCFVHSEENVKSVFDHIEEVHRSRRGGRLDEKVITHPSAVKARLKDSLKRELEAPEVRKLIARAEAVYESLRPIEGRVL
jgi:hypothetical protein